VADLPDWLRIPDGFASSGDPVVGNPFPSDDLRHQVWQKATREAEEEWARINHHRLSSLSPTNVLDFDGFLAFHAARFDVWAKRNIHVVWSDPAVTHYDGWLFGYANAMLEGLAEQQKKWPPPFSTDQALLAVRNRIAERIQYWKAEARRYRAEQEQERLATATPNVGEPSVQAGKQTDVEVDGSSKGRGLRRTAVIEPILKRYGFTPGRWATKAGVDPSVVYSYVAGRSNPRPESRKCLAEAIHIEDLPE
jgi:hypothetical protein